MIRVNLGRTGLIWLTDPDYSTSLREPKEGTRAGHKGNDARAFGKCCLLVCFYGLLRLLSFTTYDHLSRLSTVHSGLVHPRSIMHHEIVPQTFLQTNLMEIHSQFYSQKTPTCNTLAKNALTSIQSNLLDRENFKTGAYLSCGIAIAYYTYPSLYS